MPTLLAVAAAGAVILVGEDGAAISLTPKLAEELSADLPRLAAQARALAGSQNTQELHHDQPIRPYLN